MSVTYRQWIRMNKIPLSPPVFTNYRLIFTNYSFPWFFLKIRQKRLERQETANHEIRHFLYKSLSSKEFEKLCKNNRIYYASINENQRRCCVAYYKWPLPSFTFGYNTIHCLSDFLFRFCVNRWRHTKYMYKT